MDSALIWLRRLGPCLAGLALFVGLSARRSDAVVTHRVDEVEYYSLTVAGSGPFTEDDTHSLAGGTNWTTDGTIEEWEGWVNNHLKVVSGTAQHQVGPHGEGVGQIYSFEFDINADDYTGWWGKTARTFGAAGQSIFEHGPHFNYHYATLQVEFEYAPGIPRDEDQIVNYMLAVQGKHRTGDISGVSTTMSVLTPDQHVHAVDSNAFGGLNMVVDTTTGAADLVVAARGFDPFMFTGASIHLGGPGQYGPQIAFLDPVFFADFSDADGMGVIGEFRDYPFPTQHLDALLAGETYINLQTIDYPLGELRGQIVVPEPASFLLLLPPLSLLPLLGAFACRAHRRKKP